MKPLLLAALGLAATSLTQAACPPVDDLWLRLTIDIREGKLERLDCLVTAETLNGHDPKDFMQSRPLHLAARYNQPRVVQYLLAQGADPNALDFSDRTPLQLAFGERAADEAAIVLIENGANLEVHNGDGRTPLYWAIIWQRPVLVRLLLQRGADRNRVVELFMGDELRKFTVEDFGRKSKNAEIRALFESAKERS